MKLLEFMNIKQKKMTRRAYSKRPYLNFDKIDKDSCEVVKRYFNIKKYKN